MSTMISLRIADETVQRLEILAKAMGRSRSFVTIEAIEHYIEQQAWQVAQIEQAIIEANAGNFASDESVQAVMDKWAKRAN